MITRKCETCDILKPAGAEWEWDGAPASLTMAVCVFRQKWPVTNGLPRQTHNTQSHCLSYRGHPWHRRTSIQLSEVPQGDLLQAHDSFGFSGQSKWVQMTSTLLLSFSPSLLGIPQVLTSCSDSWNAVTLAHTWLVVSQGWLVPSVFLGYISITCACASFSRGSGCRSGQPVAAVETSVATDDVSCDAGPRLTPVTFLSKGMQWAQASSTSHDFSS